MLSAHGAPKIYEEVAQGVDGMVVNAVFERKFIAGWRVRIMIAGKGLDKTGTFRRNNKPAFAVTGADCPADKLNTLRNTASAVTNIDTP
jgi:hypothetical protein